MLSERTFIEAIRMHEEGAKAIVVDETEGACMPLEDFLSYSGNLHFLVDIRDDAEFEAKFDTPAADPEEKEPEEPPKRTRQEMYREIDRLAADGTKVVSEIAQLVGCSTATVRKRIK